MSEGEGLLRLDDDVARVLHHIADQRFGGDVQTAMNDCLRAILLAELKPDDPWAAIMAQARSRAERRSAQ
jgi:hypothetical protein